MQEGGKPRKPLQMSAQDPQSLPRFQELGAARGLGGTCLPPCSATPRDALTANPLDTPLPPFPALEDLRQ